jgi:uncharacterized membrane protein
MMLNKMDNTYKFIDNLLHWSRSQSGKIEFYPQKWNLMKLVVEVISLLMPLQQKRIITLSRKIMLKIRVLEFSLKTSQNCFVS